MVRLCASCLEAEVKKSLLSRVEGLVSVVFSSGVKGFAEPPFFFKGAKMLNMWKVRELVDKA